MTFVIATHNEGKLREMRDLLKPLGHELLSARDAGVTGAPEEDGADFEANARIKARACMLATGLPSVADDSGLCVDALDGAPGVHSARYAASSGERIDRLLRELEGAENRKARFVCHIVCVFPDGAEVLSRGECEGEILTERRGEGGFGYDPVFLIPEKGLTFAELPDDEKNAVSHRGRALRAFIELLNREVAP